jgi:hypothetical protein
MKDFIIVILMFILLQDGDSYVYSGSVSSSDATEQVSTGTKLEITGLHFHPTKLDLQFFCCSVLFRTYRLLLKIIPTPV